MRRKRYMDCNLIFTDDAIRVEDGMYVMMSWEDDMMRWHADVACSNGGDVLELGFGMGISAGYIQRNNPRTHTIVEIHEQVIPRLREWSVGRDSVKIIEGAWFDRFQDLGEYDGIFYDVTGEENADMVPRLIELLRPGGVFTFLNMHGGPRNSYNIDAQYVEYDVEPPKNEYFNHRKYYLPIVRKY